MVVSPLVDGRLQVSCSDSETSCSRRARFAAQPLCRHHWVLSLLGGYVYRGSTFADLIGGAYVFGDNESKNIYYIKKDGDSWTVGTIISDGSVPIIGFSEDINVRDREGGGHCRVRLRHSAYTGKLSVGFLTS